MNQIKLIAGVSIAAVMVAGAVTSPVFATYGSQTQVEIRNGHQVVEVQKNGEIKYVTIKNGNQTVEVTKNKCGKYVKIENGNQKVEVGKPGETCKKTEAPVKENPVTVKPVKEIKETPAKPVVKTVATAPVTEIVTPVTAPVTEQPVTLPEAGPGAVVAASFAGLTGLGYAANLLRLRRRG